MCLFIICLCFAFVQNAEASGKKSETTAVVLSVLLPGAGHIYTNETATGLLFMGVYTSAVAIAFAVGPQAFEKDQPSSGQFDDLADNSSKNTNKGIVYGCIAVAAGTMIWSAFDAAASARRFNRASFGFAPWLNPDKRSVGATLCLRLP
jgi:hypothetical protein